MSDVVAGIVDLMFTGPPSAKSMSEGGKLKLLAAFAQAHAVYARGADDGGSRRAGLRNGELVRSRRAGQDAESHRRSVVAPSSRGRQRSEFAERMKAQGLETVGSTPESMLSTMEADTRKWAELIKVTGIKYPQ